MNDQSEAQVGTTVYLRPTTKQAPAECYRRLAAVVVSYSAWPIVEVRIFDSVEGRLLRVHRDNIGLRRKTIKKDKQGDMTGNVDDAASSMVGKPIGRPLPPLDPDCGYEEPVLF